MSGWDDTIDAAVRAFLAEHRTAGLATVGSHGRPHAANVWYAHDEGWSLYFVSAPDTTHGTHLERDANVALTIYHDTPDPAAIRGLQVRGLCLRLTDPNADADARRLYAAKFPFVRAGPFAAAFQSQPVYRITPMWARWIDNRVRFGFKAERAFG